MAYRSKIPDATRRGIQAALLAGVGVGAAARQYKVGKSSVARMAAGLELGDELGRTRTKKATEAAAAYARIKRLELSDRLFGLLEARVTDDIEISELKEIALTFAILVDKRRLEEGNAPERHESIDPAEVVARGRERMALLYPERAEYRTPVS